MNISRFLELLEAWGKEEDLVNSIIITGHYATGEVGQDSSIDIQIISTTPSFLVKDNSFIEKFGNVIKKDIETIKRVTLIKVTYENGTKVSFGISSPLWISKPLDKGTFEILERGYKVILDKKNYFTNFKLYNLEDLSDY